MNFTEMLQSYTGKPLADCTNQELYLALLEIVRHKSAGKVQPVTGRKLYYISAEFLIGKLLSNNLINLGLYDEVKKELAAAGKSLAEIAMQYGYVYVAQVAMGANPAQTIKAITEAEAYHGPSLIIGYSPCEMHSIKGGMMNCQKEMKKAVECGYWNLFRFNPAADKKFTLDSKAPAGGYREFLMNEARYSRLTREFPERAEVLFKRNEDEAKARYEHLLKLIEMYDK